MNEQPRQGGSSSRLASLDVFRGMTIAAMILVNTPGHYQSTFAALRHARWHGWTFADIIFPFFLFIVGVAMTFSFDKRLAQGQRPASLLGHVVRRSAALVLLGMTLYAFPNLRLMAPLVVLVAGLMVMDSNLALGGGSESDRALRRRYLSRALAALAVIGWIVDFRYFHACGLRVPGVLQRIGLCYFFASLIVLHSGMRGRALWAFGLLAGYGFLIQFVAPPSGYTADVLGPEGLLGDWLDTQLLSGHLYTYSRPDPEGLLGTMSALASMLFGVLAGQWLHRTESKMEKAAGLFFAANFLLLGGLALDFWIPINKRLWSVSYVLVTSGLALHVLATLLWVIDIRGFKRWTTPFLVFGTNAILAYFLSELGETSLNLIRIQGASEALSLKAWIFQHVFAPWSSPAWASLAFSLVYVLFWLTLLIPLYRRRIFIKI